MFSVLHAQDPKSQASASAAEPRPCTHAWYALRVQSKFESVVSIALRGKGYQEFLPLYRSRRRWADRVKELDLPLFPGYLFCRFDVHDRLLPILTTPGVVCIVGAGKTPSRFPMTKSPLFRRSSCPVYLRSLGLYSLLGLGSSSNAALWPAWKAPP